MASAIVRVGAVSDLLAIFKITESWRGYSRKIYYNDPAIRERLREDVLAGAKHLLVAEVDGVIVGFASISEEEGGAFVNLVVVLQSMMRTGVALSLMEELKERYARLGAFNDVDPAMKGLYEKLGFTCTDKNPGAFRNWIWSRAGESR